MTSYKDLIKEDIICLEDGYYYYFPRRHGALSAQNLRDIANTLDEMNKDWNEQVHKELGKDDILQRPS